MVLHCIVPILPITLSKIIDHEKPLFLLLFRSLDGTTQGLADDLYEEYEPKPYIGGFSLAAPHQCPTLDIDFANGDLSGPNGEIGQIQWLRVSDDRYRKEVTGTAKFLTARGKKVELKKIMARCTTCISVEAAPDEGSL